MRVNERIRPLRHLALTAALAAVPLAIAAGCADDGATGAPGDAAGGVAAAAAVDPAWYWLTEPPSFSGSLSLTPVPIICPPIP